MSTQATTQIQARAKTNWYAITSGLLQRAAVNVSPVNEVPPIAHEVIRSLGQLQNTKILASPERIWEHDFSQVPTYTLPARAVQTKLAMNQSHDESEREANGIAEMVMQKPAPEKGEHKECLQPCWQKAGTIQRKSVDGELSSEVPSIVHEVIRSPGHPLDSKTLAFMESRFGHDFSGVRLHSNHQAVRSAARINAQAYTVGQNIVIDTRDNALGSEAGNRLLAHELVHTLQQRGSFRTLQHKKRRRKVAIENIKYPNLVLYQNHAIHGTFFRSVGNRISRRIGGLDLDLSSDECPEYARFGPIPFDTGEDIINAIETAHLCTGWPVTQVHIVSHSGPSGIYGTGSFFEQHGLYEEDEILAQADRARGGRTLADLPLDALARNVVFVLHGCSTAYGDDSFAEALLRRIVGTSSKARVYGHVEGGEAGRTTDWKEFTARTPEGRRRSTNPYHRR